MTRRAQQIELELIRNNIDGCRFYHDNCYVKRPCRQLIAALDALGAVGVPESASTGGLLSQIAHQQCLYCHHCMDCQACQPRPPEHG